MERENRNAGHGTGIASAFYILIFLAVLGGSGLIVRPLFTVITFIAGGFVYLVALMITLYFLGRRLH